MKKILIILVSIVVLVYLFFSIGYWNDSLNNTICTDIEIIIKDSSTYSFISSEDIEGLLKRNKIHPVGLMMSDINTLSIHDTIMMNKLVRSVEVYPSQKDAIIVKVHQRVPAFRIISDIKGSFYIDNNREVMPTSNSFALYAPLATGAIDYDFAKNELYDFYSYLKENSYWDAWIEQIVVKSNKDIELIPRVGDFKILMGSLDNYNEKLTRFSLFIDKGLNVVGWNRYSEINLKFDNQVVCTRR